MAVLHRIADFLIYSNLFIAVCAGGYLLSAYRVFGLEPRIDRLTVLAVSATLTLYLALRIHSAIQLRGREFTERLVWVDRNRAVAVGFLLAGMGAAVWALVGLPVRTLLALAPAAVVAFLYGLPFLPLPPRFRLRHRKYLKVFLIAAVWAWIGSVLPAAHRGLDPGSPTVWTVFVSRFLFVTAITLPFDIRDIETDRVFKLETIPMRIGVAASVRLAWTCLALSWLLLLPVYLVWSDSLFHVATVLGPLLPWYALTAVAIGWSRKTKNEYLYLGWLDGTMLGHWPLLEIGSRLI